MKRTTTENATQLYSVYAEKSVLGAALMDNTVIDGPLSSLTVNDFNLSAHQELFGTFLGLRAEGKEFDEFIIAEVLEQQHRLEGLGGMAYLTELPIGVVPDAGLLRHHAQTIQKFAQLRRLFRVGEAITQKSLEVGADPASLLDKFTDLFSSLAAGYDLDGNLTPIIPRNMRRRADIVRLDRVENKEIDWLWYPYLPLGMLTMLSGDPEVGKSYVAIAIAAAISAGCTPYSYATCKPRDTLFLSIENSPEYVLRPRFEKHMPIKGNLDRFHILRGSIIGPEGDRAQRGGIRLSDIVLLSEALDRTGASLVVIDPIQSFLGSEVDIHRANETRPVLDGLIRLAERHHCAVLLLRHLAKAQNGRAIHRGLGSIDLTGAVRTELFAGTAPDDPQCRALAQVKSNIGPRGDILGYRIDPVTGHFSWIGKSHLTVAAMLRREAEAEEKSALDDAADFLRLTLADGPRSSREVISESRELGISERTLRRAAKELQVIARKQPSLKLGEGKWEWCLPR